jgi:hypothetical protein
MFEKLPYAKTQPFSHGRARTGSSRSTPGFRPAGRSGARAESLERFQEVLAPRATPELRPNMARVDSHVAGASRLKDAAIVIARWITGGTVVVAIHLAAAKYVFLA